MIPSLIFALIFTLLFFMSGVSGVSGVSSGKPLSSDSFIQGLEKENAINYQQITNHGAYIPSMCYTKTKDTEGKQHNPCYSCHSNGKIPNYMNDAELQLQYGFPEKMLHNPYSNLFKDRSKALKAISDKAILDYVRTSNYFNDKGDITLQKSLPQSWKGYRPDCYFNFDTEGFDTHPKTNQPSGWRAFRYYPFLGTFWPTNGSTDDVLIRLAPAFSQNKLGKRDLNFYKLNLSIVEALVKQKDINIPATDEVIYQIDLNQDGVLSIANKVAYTFPHKTMHYVGLAEEQRKQGQLHLAGGLFPEGTELLHTVRYIDWDEGVGQIKLAKRMKEVRYAKKTSWLNYAELKQAVETEFWEDNTQQTGESFLAIFTGNYEQGLNNGMGWIYQGFIEGKKGELRPQTHEENIQCMGCHSGLGATTDSVFAFPRKMTNANNSPDSPSQYGWGHWSQKYLSGIKEPQVAYKIAGEDSGLQHEYSFYLKENKSGNEFRENEEVLQRFFKVDGVLKPDMAKALNNDISLLLYPSRERAIKLNKAYKILVDEQSYTKGRDATLKPLNNVFRDIEKGQMTGIKKEITINRGD